MAENTQRTNNSLIKVKCPTCGKEHDFETWQCINVTDENGLKEKILNGQMFLTTCPECNQNINVEYSFLYHQVDDHFMVHYTIHDNETQSVLDMLTKPNKEQAPMVKNLSENNYIIRLVRTKADLIEKIIIYDEGLDDRAIEILKTVVAGRVLSEKPDIKISHILFKISADEGRFFQIFSENKEVAKASFSQELYQKIVGEFIHKMPGLREDRNLFVNNRWAGDILKKMAPQSIKPQE